ncbi:uncharacterized protein [Palaemon carinicauda]|uniref:uncharacterized protein n=1 Tax=Palaemon carinicauda TaxID=392227 RepID=UPI0035B6081D
MKRNAKKRYDETSTEEDKERGRLAKKEAKVAVALSKQQALDNAKGRNKATKDITHIKQIKNADGVVMCSSSDIKGRWKQYFERLLNEENPRSIIVDENPNFGMVRDINREEIKITLSKMKNGKAMGPDEIPVEVCICLGEFGADMLRDLMQKIHWKEKMPRMWRNSFLIPIFKEKGAIQNCNNYRAIKILPHTTKLWEKIRACMIREETKNIKEQFGLMPGRSTTDAMFALRQLMEKYKGQNTYSIY